MFRKVIPANSESTKIKDKIPEYAKDFRKEWLYIRGINKKCGEILSKINFKHDNFFISIKVDNLMCHIKKFLKDQERGRLKDISCFYFKYFNVSNIECLKKKLRKYYYLSVDPVHFENEQNFFNFVDYVLYLEFPGFNEFFELISLINDKVKKEEPTFNLSQKNKN